MNSFLLNQRLCVYLCVCTQDVYNTHTYILPVRALPSPFLVPPGVKGKIPGTLDFVTCPTLMKGRKGLDGGLGRGQGAGCLGPQFLPVSP